MCVHACVCVARPVAVELRCHATVLIAGLIEQSCYFLNLSLGVPTSSDRNQAVQPQKMWLCYTPGIYAEGYIVFVFPFVRSSVCMFVCSFVLTSVTIVEFASKFYYKVSQVVYISATAYQKAFILDHSYLGGCALTL